MKMVDVHIEGARSKATSWQCPKCNYFSFDQKSATTVLHELQEQPLKISQKIIKLSNNRLGIYFNKNLIKSLKLKSGEEISVTVPDKKHILLNLK